MQSILGRKELALDYDGRGERLGEGGRAELVALSARARRIPFVTLVEHLERILRTAAPVGTSRLVRDELIRFRHDPSLVFHASDVAAMRIGATKPLVEITSTFLGATGSVSPLAAYFTEDLLRADTQEDTSALGAFYDLFHHRLLALCYRALRRSRLAGSIRKTGDDDLTRRALAIVGLGPKRPEAPLSTVALLGRSRILARRPRGRQSLEAALALAFPSLPVRVVDFFPRRVRLMEDQRLRVGVRNHRLGAEARIGRHMLGQSDMLRLCIGPVDRPTFEELLPGASENLRLCKLVEDVTGGMLDAEVEIEITAGHEPRAMLGSRGGIGARLGKSSLLRVTGSGKSLHVRMPLNRDVRNVRPVFVQHVT